jgi:hypothetical protein
VGRQASPEEEEVAQGALSRDTPLYLDSNGFGSCQGSKTLDDGIVKTAKTLQIGFRADDSLDLRFLGKNNLNQSLAFG